MTQAVTGGKTYTFTYYDEGIRTSKTVNGVTSTLLIQKFTLESLGKSEIDKKYTYHVKYESKIILSISSYDLIDKPFFEKIRDTLVVFRGDLSYRVPEKIRVSDNNHTKFKASEGIAYSLFNCNL